MSERSLDPDCLPIGKSLYSWFSAKFGLETVVVALVQYDVRSKTTRLPRPAQAPDSIG